jgi:hypothetical protein
VEIVRSLSTEPPNSQLQLTIAVGHRHRRLPLALAPECHNLRRTRRSLEMVMLVSGEDISDELIARFMRTIEAHRFRTSGEIRLRSFQASIAGALPKSYRWKVFRLSSGICWSSVMMAPRRF